MSLYIRAGIIVVKILTEYSEFIKRIMMHEGYEINSSEYFGISKICRNYSGFFQRGSEYA